MSRPKRTREEEIQHLKKKLRKLAQENFILDNDEDEDRASTSTRPRKASDNIIPSTPTETSVKIISSPASTEPPPRPQKWLNAIHEHITNNKPRAISEAVGINEHTLKKDLRLNLNTLEEHNSKTEPAKRTIETQSLETGSRTSLSGMEVHSLNSEPSEPRDAMADSSRNQRTNYNDLTAKSSTSGLHDCFSDAEENNTIDEPQSNPSAEQANNESNTTDKPQASLEMKNSKINSRASLDTSDPNISTKKRTNSETSTEYDNNMALDRKEALLQALGDDLTLCGENIHPSLAQKWGTILRRGLPNDDKEKLLKEYAAPENCKVLKAPALNQEVSAVVNYGARNRDTIMESNQNQLGLGITAIGRAITVILNQSNATYKDYEVSAIRHLNHGCRLLLDLHHTNTIARKHFFKKDLSHSDVFRNLKILDFERDETLFSTKVAKLVKKQGVLTTPMHSRPSTSYAEPGSNRARNFNDGHVRDGEPSRYRR